VSRFRLTVADPATDRDSGAHSGAASSDPCTASGRDTDTDARFRPADADADFRCYSGPTDAHGNPRTRGGVSELGLRERRGLLQGRDPLRHSRNRVLNDDALSRERMEHEGGNGGRAIANNQPITNGLQTKEETTP
jgi:hypothetical protein